MLQLRIEESQRALRHGTFLADIVENGLDGLSMLPGEVINTCAHGLTACKRCSFP